MQEGGCKYFAWKGENGIEEEDSRELVIEGGEKLEFPELKTTVCLLRAQIMDLRREVCHMRTVLQFEMEDKKKLSHAMEEIKKLMQIEEKKNPIQKEESKQVGSLWKVVTLVVVGLSMLICLLNGK
ncbi:unnamed protein product, partial [Cuscuta epithymum]